eukprot:2215762-Rhodomonas_salina.2
MIWPCPVTLCLYPVHHRAAANHSYDPPYLHVLDKERKLNWVCCLGETGWRCGRCLGGCPENS